MQLVLDRKGAVFDVPLAELDKVSTPLLTILVPRVLARSLLDVCLR